MHKAFTILFDCHSFDVGWQGTTTYLAGILNALPRIALDEAPELELRIICAAQHEAAIRRHVAIDFEFAQIKTGFVRRNLIEIPKLLWRNEVDLVVSQYVRPFFSPCATMTVIHDVLFLDYPESFGWAYRTSRKLLFGWAARRSNIVSTVSQYSAQRIEAHFGVDSSKIVLIPNAVDPAFLFVQPNTEHGTQRTALHLLSVSRLERRKRHEWGILAIDALEEDGIDSKLTIVGSGDGAYATELRRLIDTARRKKGRKIELKSGLSVKELAEEYKDADVFLFSSEAEGFGIPIIEAAATGTPCVCSAGSALDELAGQFSGLRFNEGDLPGFLRAVREVVRNINHHKDKASAMRDRVSETYNWDTAANAYVAQIQRLRRVGQ